MASSVPLAARWRTAALPLVCACLLGLPTASARDLFKDFGKLVKQAKLDKPRQLAQELKHIDLKHIDLKQPDLKVANDAARSADSVLKHIDLKHIDGREVGEIVKDTSVVVLKATVPDISHTDIDRIKHMEGVVEKATPKLLKDLRQADPDKVEQLLKEMNSDTILDLIDKLNMGERWLSRWPWLLGSSCIACAVLFFMQKPILCILRRRPKMWAKWAPQVQLAEQHSMWALRANGNETLDAEQPWITSEEQPSPSASL